jgi:uncharacterized membrane protein HdeD (DUF308 family)
MSTARPERSSIAIARIMRASTWCAYAEREDDAMAAQDGLSIEEGWSVGQAPAAGRSWLWLRLCLGILAIGLSIAVFAWPSATVHVIGVLFGLNLVVTGFVRAGLLLFVPGYPLLHRLLGIVFGVLTGLVGILCLRNITGSVVLLLVVVAIGWLLDGLVELFLTLGRRDESGGGWRIATAVAGILGAIALLVWPKAGLAVFIGIGATVLALVGIGQVISAVAGLRAARA